MLTPGDIAKFDLVQRSEIGIPGYSSFLVPLTLPPLIRDHPAMPAGLSFKVNPVTRRAAASMTPEAVFNTFSTAFTAPFRTYYVDCVLGNDANDGLTLGAAVKSWTRMQTLANATGQPCKAYIIRSGTGSVWGRENGPGGGSGIVRATVDMAFVARGGQIDLSTHNNSVIAASFVPVAGKPGVYDVTTSNAHMVIQRLPSEKYGFTWGAYEQVDAIDQVDEAEGSFFIDTANGKVRLHVKNGVIPGVSYYDIRILRPVPLFEVQSDVNIGFFCESGTDSWLMMGGSNGPNASANGGASIAYAVQSGALPQQMKCLVTHRVTTAHGFRGLATDGLHGLHYAFDCRGYSAGSDWINSHIVRAGTQSLTVVVNGFSRDMGRKNTQSAQGLTLHDTPECIGMSLCNDYDTSGGCHIRNIGGSRCLSAFDTFGFDRGDVLNGGTVESCNIQVDGAGTLIYVMYPYFKKGGSFADIRALSQTIVKVFAPDSDLTWGGAGTVDLNWKPGTA
ncbi:hypothetical protein [Asticcacaulis sp. AND118]|uniref:hypothetical protein n=1 Tax=Asticcacaulis sp. AND118 TaxID=2840468 RepID=UPI001CFFA27B|nr:hypothetical protein [Asticcacaulis sp. AND118]UDF05084.1 hypothetical protein LH365_16975 [Asticcacaulis sp. AND118]